MTRVPPRLATFLVERCGDGDPTLLGDLAEEYAAGRSRLWYWREALAATTHAIVNGARTHPVVLVRALAAYAAFYLLAGLLFVLAMMNLHVLQQIVPVTDYLRLPLIAVVRVPIGFVFCMIASWTVARFHPRVRVLATLIVIAIGSMLVVRGDTELQRLWTNVDDARFIPYLIVHVSTGIAVVCGLVVGGVLLPISRASATNDARLDRR